MADLERTLVLLKPDAVARGLAGRLIQRFEDAGLKLVGMKMRQMDPEFTKRHYHDIADRHGQSVYEVLAGFIQQGPVIAMVLEGAEAVGNVRRIVGPTYPDQAAPGTIRGDFAHHLEKGTGYTPVCRRGRRKRATPDGPPDLASQRWSPGAAHCPCRWCSTTTARSVRDPSRVDGRRDRRRSGAAAGR